MLLSTGAASTGLRAFDRTASLPVLPRLLASLAVRRQRQRERTMVEAVVTCGHAGVMDDFHMACRTHGQAAESFVVPLHARHGR